MLFKHLCRVNPEYDPSYWGELEALNEGGKALLGDRELLRRLMPPNPAESPEIYDDRLKRAV